MKRTLSFLLVVGVIPPLILLSSLVSPGPIGAHPALPITTTTSTTLIYLPLVAKNYIPPYVAKIYTTPDYYQLDPDYGGLPHLPGDPPGAQYCAPVAVSNSLMWLDDNGFDDWVAPDTTDRKKDQFDTIVELGSPSYMNTSLVSGTGVYNLTWGVHNYVLDRGYEYIRLEYQGWRYHSPQFSTGIDVPNLDWVKRGIEGYGSVWLNVGWYTYDAASDEYTRVGGHWLTLVGYGHDGSGEDPRYLVVHDPGSGGGLANEYIFPERINSGTLRGPYEGLPRSAVGFHKLIWTAGMHVSSSADPAILDGVVVLEMPTPLTYANWLQLRPRYLHRDTSVGEIDNMN